MKRVLLISYYWPPAGGISVLRTLKIAKYLRNFNWKPVIYTASNPSYPYIDEGNLRDIPEGIEIIKQPIIEPFNFFKKLSGRKKNERLDNILQVRSKNSNFFEKLGIWVRANFFIPDARSLWIRPSVRHLSKYLRENPVDAIFSDGPPHTNTMIAYHLSKKLDIPWLADFQDPWTQADYYELFPITTLAHRWHSKLEQRVFKQSRKITIASPSWKQDLETIGAHNVDVIYYGYDEADFCNIQPNRVKDKLIISHAGILGNDRFPDNFFIALADIFNHLPELKKKVQIKLMGEVDWLVKEKIKNLGLEEYCTHLGFIPRQKVLQINNDSHLLLLPLNKATNAKGRLPGKLYEYLRSGTKIMGFGFENSDASAILKVTKTGVCLDYDNYKDIYSSLYDTLTTQYTRPMVNPEIKKYSNTNQTKKIAKLLDQISTT